MRPGPGRDPTFRDRRPRPSDRSPIRVSRCCRTRPSRSIARLDTASDSRSVRTTVRGNRRYPSEDRSARECRDRCSRHTPRSRVVPLDPARACWRSAACRRHARTANDPPLGLTTLEARQYEAQRPLATDAGLKLAVHRAAPRRVREVDPVGADLIERSERLADLAQQRLGLAPTSSPARERARQLRDHLEGFVRPRAADIEAPLIVLLLGPTGAGKSSLLNTIAGAEVSKAGVLRPTTREAVLYASESDAKHILSGDRLRLIAGDRIIHVPAPESSSGVAVIEGDVDPNVNGLARETVRPLLDRIAQLTTQSEERRSVAMDALAGAVRGLAPLVHAVADDLEHEAIDAEALRRIAETAYADELAKLSRDLRGGVLLRQEVLRRWHDFVGADQVTRFIASGLGRLRGLLLTAFRGTPTAPVAIVEEEIASTLEALALRHATEAARRTASTWSERSEAAALIERDAAMWSASDRFAPAIREGLATWMRTTIDDVRAGGGRKRAVAQVAALGVNAVGVAVMLGVFAHTAGLTGAELGIAAGTAYLNQKLLEALFGERAMEQLLEQARARLEALLT